jgi:hypothetical protein
LSNEKRSKPLTVESQSQQRPSYNNNNNNNNNNNDQSINSRPTYNNSRPNNTYNNNRNEQSANRPTQNQSNYNSRPYVNRPRSPSTNNNNNNNAANQGSRPPNRFMNNRFNNNNSRSTGPRNNNNNNNNNNLPPPLPATTGETSDDDVNRFGPGLRGRRRRRGPGSDRDEQQTSSSSYSGSRPIPESVAALLFDHQYFQQRIADKKQVLSIAEDDSMDTFDRILARAYIGSLKSSDSSYTTYLPATTKNAPKTARSMMISPLTTNQMKARSLHQLRVATLGPIVSLDNNNNNNKDHKVDDYQQAVTNYATNKAKEAWTVSS